MHQANIEDPSNLINIAERIKKVMADSLAKKLLIKVTHDQKTNPELSGSSKSIAEKQFLLLREKEKSKFPKILEQEVEDWHKRQRQQQKSLFERNSMIRLRDTDIEKVQSDLIKRNEQAQRKPR